MNSTTNILTPGRTVWRLARAGRVALLVDGESYYRAVAHTLANARHSVFLLGWDVHSKIELLRGGADDGLPRSLGGRFAAMLKRRRDLQVYVLDWDYPVFFAQERESRLRMFSKWPASRRFHLHYDAFHPPGGSQHQKIVVVDDRIAFSGGMDIGLGRWDTSEHLAQDDRRDDPGFGRYVPSHDVMMMADGEVARAAGELARDRWRRATGQDPVPAAPDLDHDAWPGSVTPDLEDATVGIARTQPAHGDRPGFFEVEAQYVAAIEAARERIYIENQYLTSDVVVDALTSRLRQPNGPEIVIALPQNNYGWFEARTIQVLHFGCIRRLKRADAHDRLRICYPSVPDLGEDQVNLHSKVMVVDERFMRIGSSNLTNRSMRLDTECDFSIESDGDARTSAAIARFRNRLLGEHLCMEPDEVARELEQKGSLLAIVDARTGTDRCLCHVEPDPEDAADIGNGRLVDPKGPVTPETVIETFAGPDVRRRARPRIARLVASIVVLAMLAAMWRWTPLGQWLDPATLSALGAGLRESAFAPLAVVAIYVVTALVALPVTLLVLVTASVFGPWLGIAYSLAGSLASAMLMFSVGRALGRDAVEQLTGRQYRRIADGLRHRGIPTVVVLRMLPIAPFTIVNMVVGVTGIGAREFAVGTMLGMLPGIVALSLFQAQLAEAMHKPDLESLLLLALVSISLAATLAWVHRRLRVRRDTPAAAASLQSERVAAAGAATSISATSGR